MTKNEIYFSEGKGLVTIKGEEEIVVYDYCPEVISIEKQIDLKTGNHNRTVYSIKLKDKHGNDLGNKKVTNLNNLSFFKLWGVSDAQMSNIDRNFVVQKLQCDVEKLKLEAKNTCVMADMGFCKDDRMIILGDKVIGGKHLKVEITNPLPLKDVSFLENMSNDDLSIEADKFLRLWPEVTVPLFYVANIPIIKYIIPERYYKFVPVLVGPAGHLKTTLAILYCLFLKDENWQKCTIRGGMRTNEMCTKIDQLKGLFFLVDDMHSASMSQNNRQQADRADIVVRHITTHEDTADVIMTAENTESLGGFSAQDRMFTINVPRMTSFDLGNKKMQLSNLKSEIMVLFFQRFIKALLNDWDNVKRYIRSFWEKDDILPFMVDNTIRASTYVKQILLVEELCRIYMFSGDEQRSCKNILMESLEKNYKLQLKNMNRLREKEIEQDYVIEVYNLLVDESKKIQKNEFSIIYCDEDEYRVASTPKILYQEKGYDKFFLITRENLQRALMERENHMIQINKVVKRLKEEGILQTYGDGGATMKINGFPRHLVISQYCLIMYVRNEGITIDNENMFTDNIKSKVNIKRFGMSGRSKLLN